MTRPLLWILLLTLGLTACGTAQRSSEAGSGRSAASTSRTSAVPGSAVHIVRDGETLYSIARRYGLSVQQLAAWNNLGDGTMIRVNQRLRLSAPGGATAASPAPQPRVEPPPRWQWPVSGKVLSRYGESPLTASGIQIGGRVGDPVRAAAGGQVVYSGNGLIGYGELLIIKHSDNWLSAYGYNQARLVAEGERVSAGQQIAR
ncbi:MAG: peptidoglycan DD-metalloendopeptidase family protein, partial [Chromatiales bacterium]|nr:peptidoglycan DD-metalloendopeptidase family protein [Chromatiales bacterium]